MQDSKGQGGLAKQGEGSPSNHRLCMVLGSSLTQPWTPWTWVSPADPCALLTAPPGLAAAEALSCTCGQRAARHLPGSLTHSVEARLYSCLFLQALSTQSDVLQITWSLWHPFLFYCIQTGLYSQPPVCEGLQASLTLNTLTELSSSKFQPVFCPSSAPKPGIFSVVGAWFCAETLSRRGAL